MPKKQQIILPRFVQRGPDGEIVSTFACPQEGYATEELLETHPEIVAYNKKRIEIARQPGETFSELLARVEELEKKLKEKLTSEKA